MNDAGPLPCLGHLTTPRRDEGQQLQEVTAARPSRARHTTSAERAAIWALAAGSAVGGTLAACHPTGLAVPDAIYGGTLAALTSLAASRGRRWSWLVTAAVAVAFAGGWAQVLAMVGLLAAFGAGFMDRRWRPLGAAIGAISAQALLRLPNDGPLPFLHFHGATALIAAAGLAPVLISGYRHAKRRSRRITRYVLAGLGVATVAFAVVFGASTIAARTRVEHGITASRQSLQAAREGHLARAEALLESASSEFDAAHSLVGSWWAAPARVVPVLAYQADALSTVTDEGFRLATTARATVRTGNYHDLRYQSGAFNLDLVRQIRGPLSRSTAALESADRTVRSLSSPWLLSPVRTRLDEYRDDLVDALDDAEVANQGAKVIPDLLGGNGPRRYLVLFTTPSEQRGLGGFIGDYAELTAIDGKVRLVRSGPIADLIDATPPGVRTLNGPADYLRRYGQYQIADYFQDLTLSPDFPSVASVASQLYPQSGGAPVDGVIAVDPYGLQALLTFTGPIRVDGLDQPLTRENAAQILLRDQYLKFGRNDDRADFLREASRLTFQKLTEGSLPAPESIARVMSSQTRDGHFLMWSPVPAEEHFFDLLHATGAFPTPDGGDLFAVRAQNSAHNKIDIFLHRSIDYRATFDPATGRVDATATVTFRNDAPASGLPDYVIGNTANLPKGTNRMNLAFYSPLRVTKATVSGLPITYNSESELRWQVATMPLAVPAGQSRTVVLHLSGTIGRGPYHLTLAPQPAVNPATNRVSVTTTDEGRAGLAATKLTEVTTVDPGS